MAVAVSPGAINMELSPGEIFEGEIKLLNPSLDDKSLNYTIKPAPMTFEDEFYDLDFEDKTDYSQIVDWIEVEEPTGTLFEHEEKIIKFRVNVPEDAPAGGQYASFLVSTNSSGSAGSESSGVSIKSRSQIAVLLYSTVAGETRIEGKVLENNISGFYLGRPITTSSFLSNTGNVHIPATYTLRIFPLFSDEEIYTNEESPIKNTVIPGTRLFSEQTWDETPKLGIFRIEQEIDFGDLITVEKRLSVVCPIWFLVLVLAFLASLILAAIERGLKRKKKKGKKK
ncbi:hypothetical protein IJ380_02730 [Candidatus Saccharibacteria bacterium]|nr:hypothetical protein [Candidatus Saccharibacteria bacterium]